MREYHFDPEGELPVVRVTLASAGNRKQVTLVLDTGCAITQVHYDILKIIGCGEDKQTERITIGGVTGEGDSAYMVKLDSLRVFGNNFDGGQIAGVDFSKWAHSGIEGLLGWDLIRNFHFDMDGPKGVLRVLDWSI